MKSPPCHKREGKVINMNLLARRFQGLYSYRFLLQQLVEKDVKLKYRRSFLGYIWSILNPLMIMMIMVIVFSNMFRFDIESYPVYLIIGQTLFNFVNESTTLSINSIMENAPLLKKTYVPKYIFTISKVTSSLVNLLFALGAMLVVFLVCKVNFNIYFLFIPVILIQIYVFSLGLGLFLAQGAVFFRDIQHIYGAITTAWMYLTPIFYPIAALPVNIQKIVITFNPMYSYITQFRTIVMEGSMPPFYLILSGIMISLVAFMIGALAFSKTQDKFILYI